MTFQILECSAPTGNDFPKGKSRGQHGTPVQRFLNAGAALELMAIIATAPGQRQHSLAPCPPCQCGHIEIMFFLNN